MSTLVEELSRNALSLPPEERIRLAEELLATVQEVDAEVEAAWCVFQPIVDGISG